MRPFFSGREGRWLAAAALLLVMLSSAALAVADDCKRVPNILVLFDASGFMREKDRYKHLLQQMEFFQQALPLTADGFFDVGLRHYGLKVGMGCHNTESIISLGPWDPERFINSFPKTVSYGMASLAEGLRGAADDVAGATGKSVIIVIGGGNESCKGDPIKATQQICTNNPDLEIHTFQIGSTQDGSFFMRGIAETGRGTYNILDDSGSPALWYAWMKKNLVMPCPASVQSPAALAAPTFGPITFDPNASSVRSRNPSVDAANLNNLQVMGQYLREHPGTRLIIHGFSDGKGSVKAGLKLARKRAEATAHFLTTSHQIPASQISMVIHGTRSEKSGGAAEFEIPR